MYIENERYRTASALSLQLHLHHSCRRTRHIIAHDVGQDIANLGAKNAFGLRCFVFLEYKRSLASGISNASEIAENGPDEFAPSSIENAL